MATRKCPRCRVKVDSWGDKSSHKWKWSKRKPPTYVCTACECELIAKERKTLVNYTMNQSRDIQFMSMVKTDLPLKKSKRKKKLCPQCKEVTFLIGVAVYGDNPKLLVCSNKCKLRRRRQDREESAA